MDCSAAARCCRQGIQRAQDGAADLHVNRGEPRNLVFVLVIDMAAVCMALLSVDRGAVREEEWLPSAVNQLQMRITIAVMMAVKLVLLELVVFAFPSTLKAALTAYGGLTILASSLSFVAADDVLDPLVIFAFVFTLCAASVVHVSLSMVRGGMGRRLGRRWYLRLLGYVAPASSMVLLLACWRPSAFLDPRLGLGVSVASVTVWMCYAIFWCSVFYDAANLPRLVICTIVAIVACAVHVFYIYNGFPGGTIAFKVLQLLIHLGMLLLALGPFRPAPDGQPPEDEDLPEAMAVVHEPFRAEATAPYL